MATLSPNQLITPTQQRWSCVLDPSLVFSDYGLLLVQSLGKRLELWVARELWHILDNSAFYCQQPTFAMPPELEPPEREIVAHQNRAQVLKNWETVRAETPLTHLNLFWMGDKPGESFLPDGVEAQVIEQWEALARSLDERSYQQSGSASMLTPAFRDTAALAAVLGSAFILTYQLPGDGEQVNQPPEICLILEQWGISCKQIAPLDAIAVIERERLLQLMVSTGLSKLLWAGLHLVILHLVVPSAFTSYRKAQPRVMHFFREAQDPEISSCTANGWEGAQGFWYQL
jgi:hypothetical protein